MENSYNQFNNQNNNQIQQYKQKSNRKKYLYIIGPLILFVALVGITYAFFNYTRTGSANSIKVGKVYFNTEQNGAFNLTNMFPIEPTQANLADNTKVGTVTIDVIGDTTYDNGIEYLVTATNVQNTVGTGNNQKRLPIGINVSYEAAEDEEIGTASNSYFSVRGGNTSYYKLLSSDTINEGDRLVVGYIAKGATGIDGTITIKAYLDSSKIAISDTYDGSEIDNMGTTSSWVNGRTVLTTTEWNSLQTNGVSFQVKVEANEGIWVKEQIKYNANGGSVSPAYKEIENNATTYGTLPTPTAPEGYIFGGWYTDPVNGTEVTASTSYTQGTSATTLYAHWTPTAATMIGMVNGLEEVAGAKRYVGANPNNYVIFNNEQWRIIGVYGSKLKIIKANVSSDTKKYRANRTDGNVWEGSILETYLNQETEGGYYYSLSSSAKEMISSESWNVGGTDYRVTPSQAYTEAQATTINRKVGLLATYEFLYAAGSACREVQGNSPFETPCGSNDWLSLPFDTWDYEWTVNPNLSYATRALKITSGHYLDYAYLDSNGYYRPVVYLNTNVVITGGTGEPGGNEYILSYTAS